MIFDSTELYIESATSLEEKITKIDEVIDGLFSAALKSAGTGHIESYTLNDGQTQINARYKDAAAITASIRVLEQMKQTYVNRLNGRTFRLVDIKNIR